MYDECSANAKCGKGYVTSQSWWLWMLSGGYGEARTKWQDEVIGFGNLMAGRLSSVERTVEGLETTNAVGRVYSYSRVEGST